MSEYTPREVMQEYQFLKNARTPYEPAWRELAFITSPRRNRWLVQKDRPTPEFYDRFSDTGVLALRQMVDGVLGAVFNPAHQWFASQKQDEFLALPAASSALRLKIPDIGGQLSAVDEMIGRALRRGKFYTAAREFLTDLYGMGNGLTMFWNSDQTGAPVYKTEHMKNVWFSENADKEIDRVYRRVIMRKEDVATVFNRPDDQIPAALKTIIGQPVAASPLTQDQYGSLDPSGMNQVVFIHCISYDYDSKRWNSHYIWEGTQGSAYNGTEGFVRESYFEYKPFAVARCYTNSDEVYGYCPGHDVLGSLLTANQMAKSLLKAGQISVDPILVMDASFRDAMDLTPGAVNYTTNPDAMAREVYKISQYPIAKDQSDRVDTMILQAYFADFFRLLSNMTQRMTAVQVMALQGEKAPLLSGLTNSLETDYLVPILRGTFEIEKAAKRIPENLANSFEPANMANLYTTGTVKFTGMLPQLAENFQLFGDVQKFLTVQNAAIQTFQDRSIGDWTDSDQLADLMHQATNMPPSLKRTRVAVDALRKQKQQQMEQQQQSAAAQQALAGIRDTGSKPDPGSPGDAAQTYLSQGNEG